MGAPTEYFCEPNLASASGAGTVGDPYGTLEYALAQITRDTTNGDQINMKSNGDHVCTSSLTIGATYGFPTSAAPLVFRGYDSASGDGGMGGISGGGTYKLFDQEYDSIWCIDMHLHNVGSATRILDLDNDCHFINCEIDNAGVGGIYCDLRTLFMNCHFHNIAKTMSNGTAGSRWIGNFFDSDGDAPVACIRMNGSNFVGGNIFYLPDGGGAIHSWSDGGVIMHNSILGSGGNTGIQLNIYDSHSVTGNIVEGYTTTGGQGIDGGSLDENTIRNNACYNNLSNYVLQSGMIYESDDNETLSTSGFAKSGSPTYANRFVYFAPVDTGNVFNGAYHPSALRDKGAVQHADAGTGTLALIQQMMGRFGVQES